MTTDTQAAQAAQTAQTALEALVHEAVARQRLVGAVVLASRDGVPLARCAAGWADREAGIAMHEHTRLRLASVSKLVTAVAVMRLVDAGRLRVHDPVARWLPRFTPRGFDGEPALITVEHLLLHSAGLGYPFLPPLLDDYQRRGISSGLDSARPTLEAWLQALAAAPLAAPPGERFAYSVASDVLGAVVAVCAGTNLPAAVQAWVAEPLGLRSLAFRVAASDDLAVTYISTEGAPRRMAEPERLNLDGVWIELSPARALDAQAFPSGGAGMVGHAGDVLTLLEALPNPAIIRPAMWQAMRQPRLGPRAAALGPGNDWGYAGAVLVDPPAAASPLPTGTLSWGGVYGNTWFFLPETRLAVVALTNTTPEGASGGFVRALRGWIASVME